MIYPSITIQGNIVSGEILEKLDDPDFSHQSASAFGFEKGTNIRDNIGDAWAILRRQWEAFRLKREKLSADHTGFAETRQFWIIPFFSELGYDVAPRAKMEDAALPSINSFCKTPADFPIHIESYRQNIDKRPERGGSSPHARMQEYLNKTDDHLYGLVTNGLYLRLLRDASRLVKLSYLEFNLEKIMEDELYADFAILYRILHASRMPQQTGDGENSIIEDYHLESMAAGTRIREKLSEAVEKSIVGLANGFLQHPANHDLRNMISESQLSHTEFYQYMLRLIYRILFLSVVEERKLLYPENISHEQSRLRDIYYRYYSIERFRKLAGNHHFVDKYKQDLWDNLRACFHLFEKEKYGHKLGINPLGGELFGPDGIGILADCHLGNQAFMEMMLWLNYFEDERKQMVRVNYGDLDVEEFGSVYEGLLEYDPVITTENGQFTFAFEAGDARGRSGSHYTPEELVKPLIKHSLDYILDDCIKRPHERLNLQTKPTDRAALRELREKALLSITVCDVACGSGHILLSAARRIGVELARVRTGDEQPDPASQRTATRDVIRHCIYGVDKNPLAVELCKVALWLEAHNPGEPLNFLNHKIKCGDSVVGFAHRDELQNGIADEAFKLLPGDDKLVAKTFREQNKKERKEREAKLTQLKAEFEESTTPVVAEDMETYVAFTKLPETTPDEIARKQQAYQKYLDGKGHQWLRRMADTQVSQFFIPKTPENQNYLITDADYRQMLAGYKGWQGQKPVIKAELLAGEKGFFHWFVEFPEIFEEGGFDCILGNPPFLGRRKLSGSFGNDYLEFLSHQYTPIGAEDLVTYFFRRIFDVIKYNGFLSLISTNTITQGGAREFGLDIIVTQGGVINHALSSIKWPGLAAVEVSLITIFKGKWGKHFNLNNTIVSSISTYLDDSKSNSHPFSLSKNLNLSFKGSEPAGMGFVLDCNSAEKLLSSNPQNIDVIFPYLNGDDLNNSFNQTASRFIINFFDWDEERAKKYSDCYDIVFRTVKPERQRKKLDSKGTMTNQFQLRYPLPQKWWIYGEKRPKLYSTIKKFDKALVIARTSKTAAFTFISSKQVLNANLTIIAFEGYTQFSILQSTLHISWAWKYSTKLKTDLIYQPSDVFDTFPFPRNLTTKQEKDLEYVGETYHEHRRQLMLSLQLGLTKTYNAFHALEVQPGITTRSLTGLDKKAIQKQYGKELWNLWNHLQRTEGTCTLEEAVAGIVKLRELHVQMDQAVLEAYGWTDIQLRHNFYEVDYLPENDRTRYTIHPDARKEVLKRLLELNHQYFEEEAKQGLHKEAIVRKFYEQKGTPIPEEVNKWFKKGKAYKKPKTKTQKANEPQGGYGTLFDQLNE